MHKDKANVGDVVRSYDFKPMEDRGDSTSKESSLRRVATTTRSLYRIGCLMGRQKLRKSASMSSLTSNSLSWSGKVVSAG